MNQTTKRILSTIAIIIASVAFGVVISADLGLMRPSHAQSSAIQTTSSGTPVTTVTIPSFADVAARVMPAVVSITSTEVIKAADLRKQSPFGGDPFEFFFPSPGQGNRSPHGNRTPEEDDERKQVAGQIQTNAATWARMIAAPQQAGYRATRDAYCRAKLAHGA